MKINMSKTCDNYPIGAAEDKAAPYNEELDVEYNRFISCTFSGYVHFEGSPNMSEQDIKDYIECGIQEIIPKDACIDELIIMEE